jgi:CubicO group peptidase (beta-lactamase class C family)
MNEKSIFKGGKMISAITKRWYKNLLWLALLGLTTANVFAIQAYPHSSLTDEVDRLFAKWDVDGSPGAVLGILKDGRIIYARGYGIANLEYDIPITPQTVFRLNSLSKQFTAMCIAILVDQKKVSLNDDIRKYIPEMPEFNPPVTIGHLVHHTGGVRDYLVLQGLAGRSGGYFYTSPEVAELLSRQKALNFKPGNEYSYSNSGYFLLAEIVGRVSGIKTSEFAKKEIFDKLRMGSTHFHDNPKMIVKNRATGYLQKEGGGFKIHETQLDMIGDGGIFTTIEDYLRWDQNFYNNRLGHGGQDLINLVFSPAKLNDGKETDYAFGLRVSKYRGLRTISHGGSFVGFRSHYVQFPDFRFSVVIFSNLGSFNPGEIAMRIADLYLVDQFTEPGTARSERTTRKTPEPIKLSSEQLKRFVGNYYSDELDATAIIEEVTGNLELTLGRYHSVLTATSPSSFTTTFLNDDAYVLGTRTIDFLSADKSPITGFMMQAGIVHGLVFKKI